MAGCEKNQPAGETTNFILISICTLRADHLGCYGYERDTSPTIDQLASEGLLFEDVTSAAPWTMPAHASLLTGLYPSRHGLKSNYTFLPDHIVTMAAVLKDHGFTTAAIVNSHHLSERYGLNRGFEEFTYIEEHFDERTPTRVHEQAAQWLSKRHRRPFFLFLQFYDVHSDYTSLPQYEKQFARPYSGWVDGSTAQLNDYRKGLLTLGRADAEHLIDLYDASIRQMDDGIARLVQVLKNRGLLDSTLIIFTADHGEEFLEHGSVLHGRTYFQEIVGVPLILRGPGLPQGRRVKQMVSLVDVMPTVLGLLGLTAPSGLDGIDLRPYWRDRDERAPRFIFSEANWLNLRNGAQGGNTKRAVRHQNFKLHLDLTIGEGQLYDLLADPGETTDVRLQEVAVADTLQKKLDEFAQFPTPVQPLPPLSPEEIEKLKSLGYTR